MSILEIAESIGKSSIANVLSIPFRLIPKNTKLPVLLGELSGSKWIVDSSTPGSWVGTYEYKKSKLYRSLVKEKRIVFDIGANVGFYTLLSAKAVGKEGKVFSFEPFPKNVEYLKEHVEINRLSNVKIFAAAVSDTCGTTFFEEGCSGLEGKISTKGEIKVQTLALDTLIEKGELPIPDYLKIDVEGAEDLVLLGAQKMLKSASPVIFLSTHGADVHKKCCNFLESLAYEVETLFPGDSLEATDEIIASKKESR